MNFTRFTCMKISFLLFTVLVILFSFSSVAFASTSNDVDSFNFFERLLNFFTHTFNSLFVPAPNFFPNQMQRLETLINEKLGGIGYVFSIARDFFTNIGYRTSGITLSIPNDYFFSGYKGFTIDSLSSASTYIKLFRDVFSSFIALITAFFCYKKLIGFFK